MISSTHRFIFVHIPKTAGNALQSILADYSEDSISARGHKDGVERFAVESPHGTFKHSTLADYLAALGPEAFWSKRRFACIRNPWDRAVSFYFSPNRGRTAWNRGEFIRSLAEIHPMVSYLRLPNDPAGALPQRNIDFLIRFERLQQDFDSVCDALAIGRHPLPVRNQSDHLHYREYYDSELARLVADRFAADVAQFGYRFDDPAGMDL